MLMPARRSHRLALTLIAALTLMPVAVHAQTPEAQNQAGAYYKAGAEAYFKEDFAQAIINFKAGYDLDPNPMFLYNLSLAYAKLGNFDEALDQARGAEELGELDPQTSAKNRSRIRAYELRVEAQEVGEALVRASEGCSSDSDCEVGMSCQPLSGTCGASTPVAEPPGPSTASSSPFSVWGWAGAGIATVGVGLVVGALIVDASLDDDLDRYSQYVSENRTSEARALKADIEDTQGTGSALLYLGIVSMAAGGGLIVYDLFLDGEGPFQEATLLPSLGSDSASVDLRLRF